MANNNFLRLNIPGISPPNPIRQIVIQFIGDSASEIIGLETIKTHRNALFYNQSLYHQETGHLDFTDHCDPVIKCKPHQGIISRTVDSVVTTNSRAIYCLLHIIRPEIRSIAGIFSQGGFVRDRPGSDRKILLDPMGYSCRPSLDSERCH